MKKALCEIQQACLLTFDIIMYQNAEIFFQKVKNTHSFFEIDDNDDISSEETSDSENEIESENSNGAKFFAESFNQKWVFCMELPSVHAFRQRGHQCVCMSFYSSLRLKQKCVDCRTPFFS